jgi:putative transposase
VNDRRVDTDGERQRSSSEESSELHAAGTEGDGGPPHFDLRGLSTGDFKAALPVLLDEEATGLSPTTITRLTATWEAEYQAWRTRSLAESDFVYVWVDGVHFPGRLEEDRLCTS